jgi:hypothetical protein
MIDKLTAILSINSTAQVSLTDDDYDTINWGDTTVISLADIEAKQAEMETAKTNEATAKATAQASGNTKLLALGLTQAEATALTGYTPE